MMKGAWKSDRDEQRRKQSDLLGKRAGVEEEGRLC